MLGANPDFDQGLLALASFLVGKVDLQPQTMRCALQLGVPKCEIVKQKSNFDTVFSLQIHSLMGAKE